MKTRKTKRTLSLSLAVMLCLLAFTACSGGDSATNPPDFGETPSSADHEPTPTDSETLMPEVEPTPEPPATPAPEPKPSLLNGLYNDEHDAEFYIGMPIREFGVLVIDKIGFTKVSDGVFEYNDNSLLIRFEDNLLYSMILFDGAEWNMRDAIQIGSNKSDVLEKYGDEKTESDGSLFYHVNSKNEVFLYDDAVQYDDIENCFMIGFTFSGDTVSNIVVSRFVEAEEPLVSVADKLNQSQALALSDEIFDAVIESQRQRIPFLETFKDAVTALEESENEKAQNLFNEMVSFINESNTYAREAINLCSNYSEFKDIKSFSKRIVRTQNELVNQINNALENWDEIDIMDFVNIVIDSNDAVSKVIDQIANLA